MKSVVVAFCLLAVVAVDAVDYKPWFGRVFEVNTRADIIMQAYNHVDAHHSSGKRNEFDTFFDLSASMAVWETIAAELEVIALQSRHQSFGMDAIRFTGRYLWMNDVIGDPFSITTGVTLSAIFPPARKNIATFDHGGFAGEAHVAVGREVSCMQFWTSRLWGVFAVGLADVGSPWLRGNIAWEHNWWDRHRVELFADTIWGFGGDNLNLYDFDGYGSVQYQAVDLGVRYGYQWDNGLRLSLGYAYRVYGRNSPVNVNFALVRFDLPLPIAAFVPRF